MEPGFVEIFHEGLATYAEVPESSLQQHFRAGWALVADSPARPAAPEAEAPPTVTRAQAEKTRAKASRAAAADQGEEK